MQQPTILYAQQNAPQDTSFRDIEEVIVSEVDAGKRVGVVVGVIDKTGVRFFSYGSDGKGNVVTPETIFEIGSISKVFTALLLSQLDQAGQLNITDPIESHLPVTVSVASKGGNSITLEDLATHHSGLPRLPLNFRMTDMANPYTAYSVQEMLQYLDTFQLKKVPGTSYLYSNYAMGLLGYIVARSYGLSYDEAVVSQISNVLGMVSTKIDVSDAEERLAKGHLMNGRPTSRWDFLSLEGGGALRSTANDLALFVQANLGIKPSPLDAALSQAHEPIKQISQTQSIGLGWHIRQLKDHEIHWHNGATGGFYSFLAFDKSHKVGVVILSNNARSVDDLGWQLMVQKLALVLEPAVKNSSLSFSGGIQKSAASFVGWQARVGYAHKIPFIRFPGIGRLDAEMYLGINRLELAGKNAAFSAGVFSVDLGYSVFRIPLSLFLGENYRGAYLGSIIRFHHFLEQDVHAEERGALPSLPDWSFQLGYELKYRKKSLVWGLEFWGEHKGLSRSNNFRQFDFDRLSLNLTVGVVI